MVDTGSGPVYERDNALTRALNRVDEINREYGTRAGGGGIPDAPPDPAQPRVVEGGSGTVLPPPPRRVLEPIVEQGDRQTTDEEEAALQKAWDDDLIRRGLKPAPPSAPPAPPTGRTSVQQFLGGVAKPTSFTDFSHIDFVRQAVIADNGETFPVTPEEMLELRGFAFRTAARSVNQAMMALASRLGLTVEEPKKKEEEKKEADKEAPNAGLNTGGGDQPTGDNKAVPEVLAKPPEGSVPAAPEA